MSTILNAWHDHEIETMKKMWLAGNSATEIARVLPSRSRNSVIAKVHRLGLTRERMEARFLRLLDAAGVMRTVTTTVRGQSSGALPPRARDAASLTRFS